MGGGNVDSKVIIPAYLFTEKQVGGMVTALGKLFEVEITWKEGGYVISEKQLAGILKMMPEIRKWQICYAVAKEEMFQRGIELSSQTIRNKVRNNASFLKEHGIAQEEMIDLLEEFIREFTERIFKEKK